MSILKKVIRAVKKLFKSSVKRRRMPKKRRTKPAKPRKPSKSLRRPSVPKAKTKPKVVKVRQPQAKAVAKAPKISKPAGLLVGEVTHYFDRIKVCVIRIDRDHIKRGDRLLIAGAKGELKQTVSSMQIENEDVPMGKKGQLIGLKVAKPVFVKDGVYKT